MDDYEIEILRRAIAAGPVFWICDDTACLQIVRVGECAEEGAGEPCGLSDHGPYVALHNAELHMFYSAKRLSETTRGDET